MTTTRAEVGDLIKATRKADPESTITGRVQTVTPRGGVLLRFHGSMWPEDWDIEVLERPIDQELLVGAVKAFRKGSGYETPTQDFHITDYAAPVTAVINFIQSYHNKESK